MYGLDIAAKDVQAFVASGMEVEKATATMIAWADSVVAGSELRYGYCNDNPSIKEKY